MNEDKLAPVHPGEVLLEEFIKPMNLSQNQIALAIRVPARRINEIVHGKRRVTADTALRLGRYFNVSPHFWLGLQMDYDLDVAEDAIGTQLDTEVAVLSRKRAQKQEDAKDLAAFDEHAKEETSHAKNYLMN